MEKQTQIRQNDSIMRLSEDARNKGGNDIKSFTKLISDLSETIKRMKEDMFSMEQTISNRDIQIDQLKEAQRQLVNL